MSCSPVVPRGLDWLIIAKEQGEKQGLTFLILVFETGYLSSVTASERVFYYFPCICQSKEEQDKQVSLLGQITVRPETPGMYLEG